jgi:hypothetical protein
LRSIDLAKTAVHATALSYFLGLVRARALRNDEQDQYAILQGELTKEELSDRERDDIILPKLIKAGSVSFTDAASNAGPPAAAAWPHAGRQLIEANRTRTLKRIISRASNLEET